MAYPGKPNPLCEHLFQHLLKRFSPSFFFPHQKRRDLILLLDHPYPLKGTGMTFSEDGLLTPRFFLKKITQQQTQA